MQIGMKFDDDGVDMRGGMRIYGVKRVYSIHYGENRHEFLYYHQGDDRRGERQVKFRRTDCRNR